MELRRVEVLKNDEWVVTRMKDLKVGDEFRMFEPDGTRWAHNGKNTWICDSKPYTEDGEVWGVMVK